MWFEKVRRNELTSKYTSDTKIESIQIFEEPKPIIVKSYQVCSPEVFAAPDKLWWLRYRKGSLEAYNLR